MMTKPILTALAAAAALLAGGQAAAATTVYTTTLDAESPVVSPGVGLSIVTIDDSSFTMRVQAVFTGLLGGTTVAHIHCCTAASGTGNAGVATPTPSFPGFPTGVTTGFYDTTFNMLLPSSYNAGFITNNGGTPASAFAALVSGMNAGRAYLNIHSSFAPGGEIRGYYAPNAPIPEPGTYALMALGLAAVGGLAHRRRKAVAA